MFETVTNIKFPGPKRCVQQLVVIWKILINKVNENADVVRNVNMVQVQFDSCEFSVEV